MIPAESKDQQAITLENKMNSVSRDDIPSRSSIVGSAFLLLILVIFSLQLLSVPRPWIFLDNVNFLIHEGGHILFSPFGEFIYLLGGSLTQVLVPTIFFVYFLLKRQLLAAGFGLFWIGDNLISVSVYMKDARTQTLDLIGEIHDWNWLFSHMGILSFDQVIGNVFYALGVSCLILSLGGISLLLIRALQQKQKT